MSDKDEATGARPQDGLNALTSAQPVQFADLPRQVGAEPTAASIEALRDDDRTTQINLALGALEGRDDSAADAVAVGKRLLADRPEAFGVWPDIADPEMRGEAQR